MSLMSLPAPSVREHKHFVRLRLISPITSPFSDCDVVFPQNHVSRSTSTATVTTPAEQGLLDEFRSILIIYWAMAGAKRSTSEVTIVLETQHANFTKNLALCLGRTSDFHSTARPSRRCDTWTLGYPARRQHSVAR